MSMVARILKKSSRTCGNPWSPTNFSNFYYGGSQQFFTTTCAQRRSQETKTRDHNNKQGPSKRKAPRIFPFGSTSAPCLDNLELLIGDSLNLITFCTYKQIIAIVLSPSFPGWLSPLRFSPTRFLEFFSFSVTVLGTWIAAAMLSDAYSKDATSSVPTALARTSRTWIVAMPIAACQLVLLTAAEDGRLVGEDGWADLLPLAASGPGEPFVTAAGVLGLMAAWRSFYATFLDLSKFLSVEGSRYSREQDESHFWDAIKWATALAFTSCVVLHSLSIVYGEGRWW